MQASERPTLPGDRVVVRPFLEEDLARVLEIVTEPEIAEWWIDYDEESLRQDAFGDPDVASFAIELDGSVIGVMLVDEELTPGYKYAMIDVTVDRAHIGQGLGTDALRTMIRYLMERRDHHHIMIDPAAVNARAIAAYKKVGFKPVGIMRQYELGPDGVWRDALLMDMVRGELR